MSLTLTGIFAGGRSLDSKEQQSDGLDRRSNHLQSDYPDSLVRWGGYSDSETQHYNQVLENYQTEMKKLAKYAPANFEHKYLLVEVERVKLAGQFTEAMEQTLATGSIQFEQATILIVDDLENNRNLVREFLEPYDFHFVEATNGAEALEQVKNSPPDIILMDYKMPVLDGYETIQRLKADKGAQMIPVIALTASAMKDVEGLFQEICEGYLRKPVTQSQLIRY